MRKEQLARRVGQHCAYCRRPFATLDEATLDHIVPLCLFRTFATVHLALACVDCNNAKGNRLPLTMALLLLWSADRHTPPGSHVRSADLSLWRSLARLALLRESADSAVRQSGPYLHQSCAPGVVEGVRAA